MEAVQLKFVLGDVLPTYYEAAISIFSVAVKPSTSKMKQAINAYANSLIDIWERSFTRKHVLGKTAVLGKIEKLVSLYYNKVYNVAHRSTKKHTYDVATPLTSIRAINREWKKTSIEFTTNRRKTSFPVTSLFDIVKDKELLTGAEKVFYHDQLNARKCTLSEEIDNEWLVEQLAILEQQEEYAHVDEDSVEDDDIDAEVEDKALEELNISTTRSGLRRILTEEKEVQTTFLYENKPPIRGVRDCTMQIKNVCVKVSVKCGISTSMAAVAVQAVCKELYGHVYYLTKEEAIREDPNLTAYRKLQPEEKKRRLDERSSGPSRPLSSKADYIPYKDVLPAPRTLNDYKELLAVQEEANAADALFTKKENVRCTLHYDTTSRNKIDGEWPSIIFSFTNKQRFVLRPIFFAYEDRTQITKLLLETLERLAVLVNRNEQMTTAECLWEKIDIIMTDSVEKNLHIEDGIAAALGSSHIPLHLLCKAHTVEALDRSNIKVLAELEGALKFREALESINPGVKSFLRGEKSVVLCAIKSILNFVSHDKSSSSTNQAELFDYVLQRENKVKHMSLYQERRFTKLGYSCASILDAVPYIQMVLNETNLSNLHTEIVQLFLDSELLFTELLCLAYFTHRVSLPLLYAVEVCNQDELCDIFPRLYNDLINGSMDTLSDYIVKYKHLPIQEPASELEKEILGKMCADAAETIDRQCGREYGFGKFQLEKPRATQIFKLSKELRQEIDDTNNVIAECNLSVFDQKAIVAKSRNYKFKAKGIRNDVVLHKSSFDTSPDQIMRAIVKILNKREDDWTTEQKRLQKLKIEQKMELAKKQTLYVNKLLKQCKSWGGPVASIKELESVLKRFHDQAESVVKTELKYYKHTHRQEVTANPTLFSLIKVTHEERLSNLMVLLNHQILEVQTLPKNSDALKHLRKEQVSQLEEEIAKNILEVNDVCVTLWNEGGKLMWYIGYCTKVISDQLFEIEHIQRCGRDNLKWRYPSRPDIQQVEPEQILECSVEGEWNILSNRNSEFTLRNHEVIQQKFSALVNDLSG